MRVPALLTFLTVLGPLAACGGDPAGSAGPEDSTCPGAQVPLCTDAGLAAGVALAIDDAALRIAPSLAAEAEVAIEGDLAALAAALDAGNVTAGLATAAALRSALAARRAAGPLEDLASLDAIALAVIRAELVLGASPAALPSMQSD